MKQVKVISSQKHVNSLSVFSRNNDFCLSRVSILLSSTQLPEKSKEKNPEKSTSPRSHKSTELANQTGIFKLCK